MYVPGMTLYVWHHQVGSKTSCHTINCALHSCTHTWYVSPLYTYCVLLGVHAYMHTSSQTRKDGQSQNIVRGMLEVSVYTAYYPRVAV